MSFHNLFRHGLLAGYYGATLPYRRWSNARRFAAGRRRLRSCFITASPTTKPPSARTPIGCFGGKSNGSKNIVI